MLDLNLKPHVKEEKDYKVIDDEVWQIFALRYGF